MNDQWVKCADEFPPIGEQVLAYGPGKGELIGGARMEICIYDGHEWWDEGGTELSSWGDQFWTHWMRLPKPPAKSE